MSNIEKCQHGRNVHHKRHKAAKNENDHHQF